MGIEASLLLHRHDAHHDNILQDSILSLGSRIRVFYYAMTGYACVWY